MAANTSAEPISAGTASRSPSTHHANKAAATGSHNVRTAATDEPVCCKPR